VSCDPEGVTGYVDGALPPEQREAVEAHLAECAACRSQVESERDLKQGLRSLPPVEPPAGLELRLRRGLRAERPVWGRVWLPVAAILAAMVVWAAVQPPFVALELAMDHDHCFGKPRLPARVWSSDGERVAEWFESQGTRVPMVPDAVAGLELVGARYCRILDRSVGHLYYVGPHGPLSVYVVPGRLRLSGRYALQARGKAVRLFHTGGTAVAIVTAREDLATAFERAFAVTTAEIAPPPRVDPFRTALLRWDFLGGL
jgi:anti-sigma factor RsiW